jgi:hypothetical protein
MKCACDIQICRLFGSTISLRTFDNSPDIRHPIAACEKARRVKIAMNFPPDKSTTDGVCTSRHHRVAEAPCLSGSLKMLIRDGSALFRIKKLRKNSSSVTFAVFAVFALKKKRYEAGT